MRTFEGGPERTRKRQKPFRSKERTTSTTYSAQHSAAQGREQRALATFSRWFATSGSAWAIAAASARNVPFTPESLSSSF